MGRFCGFAVVMVAVLTVSAQDREVIIALSTLECLQKIGRDADYPLGGHYIMENDIDVSATKNTSADYFNVNGVLGWEPIGRSAVVFTLMPPIMPPIDYAVSPNAADSALFSGAFTGTFDGNGHKITGLSIYRYHPMIPTNTINPLLSAGLFGALDGAAVINLTIVADTISISAGVPRSAAGALAGFSRNSTIQNVHVSGVIWGEGNDRRFDSALGGLVGRAVSGDFITHSSSAVTINSYFTRGAERPSPGVTDQRIVGGLVGGIEQGKIERCSASVTINGIGHSAGGLAGEASGSEITRSAAKLDGLSSLAFEFVGGLAGIVSYAVPRVPPCPEGVACADAPATPPIPARISQSYSQVNIIRMAGMYSTVIGGLIGFSKDGGAFNEIYDNYSLGSIHSLWEDLPAVPMPSVDHGTVFGGLIGRVALGFEIDRNYAAVAIDGYANRIGGLIGEMVGHRWNGDVDFFSADEIRPPPCANCYWDSNLCGVVNPYDYGLGRTTYEMKRQNTFAGWDFTNVWRINEGESYPYFAWQGAPTTSISRNTPARGVNRNSAAPTVTVRGRTLNVKTSSSANLQVRLVDMRGRTAAHFNVTGGTGSHPLKRVAAGRYLVDMRETETGRRFTSSVVLR